MTQVRWTTAALADLDTIRRYIAQFNPGAARHLANRLLVAGNNLAHFPHRGRIVANGLREITSVYPYVIRYEISGDEVLVLRVRHGMRRP